jgi:alpha-galactosidase
MGESWRHPTGWQAVVRTGADARRALVVLHTFANPSAAIEVSLPAPPAGGWKIEEASPGSPRLSGGTLLWRAQEPFSASVLLLSGGAAQGFEFTA